MKIRVEKIRLNELKAFVESARFSKLETIPVSLNRVRSYLNNPHALPDDVVLYLGFIDEKLVAFRSLFADRVVAENDSIRFGWCSGNWVHPEFRRKGFSEQLLTEAYADWDQKLMFTNYAPNSESLYLKTGWFLPVHRFEGARAYLFPKLRKLMADSDSNVFKRWLYSVLDFDIEVISSLRLLFYRAPQTGKFRFELIERPDSACYDFLEKHASSSVFGRKEKELNWIFTNPWISKTKNPLNEKYPFSWYCEDFQYHTLKFFRGEEMKGFLLFSVREKHLKTLYFAGNYEVVTELVGFLKNYARQHKIEVITTYKTELASQFLQRKFPFLHVKKYGQKIYSTFELPDDKTLCFQDGDGDVIFT